MKNIYDLITLICARGLSILGFFLLPTVMLQNDFKSYVLFFSIWQILSQFISLQLGATFFRYGLDKKYNRIINILVNYINRINICIPLIYLPLIALKLYLFAAFIMSLQFAIFNIYSDFARSFIAQGKVFKLQIAPGLLYLLITIFCLLQDANIFIQTLLIAEWISYYLLSIYLYRIISAQYNCKHLMSWSNQYIRRIYGAWKKVSLPLLPNNMAWYFYFNAPQIFGYYYVTESNAYNQQAILFRAIVALSTLSSTIVLVLQKKVITIYEQSKHKYYRIKKITLFIIMPFSLIVLMLFSIFINSIIGFYTVDLMFPVQYQILPKYTIELSFLFWLFLSVFSLSHYFMSEKNMTIIVPSMLIGLVLYCLTIMLGYYLSISFTLTTITALILSLLLTLLIRYVWLVTNGEKYDAKKHT